MSTPAPLPDAPLPVHPEPFDSAASRLRSGQAESKDLRAEHDALASKLAVRKSIDHFRAFGFLGFAAFIAFGMTCKLAWDRWGPPPPGLIRILPPGGPMFFVIALLVTLVLVALAVRSYRRYARLAADEAALFARLKELRAALGYDA